jgi:hypothetical protein
MSAISELIRDMSLNATLPAGRIQTLPNAYILKYNSMTINIKSSGTTLLKVFGGANSTVAQAPIIVQKTLQPNSIYSRTLDIVSTVSFVTLENTGSDDSEIELTTIGSFVREPNSLVRQHVEVDATNNISLQKPGTTYDIDLSRSLLQNQEAPDIVGSGLGVTTVPTTLWGTTSKSVYDDLPQGEPCQIQSTSINDLPGGSGAHTVKVSGLLSDYSKAEETISLNGIAPVTLNTEFMRVNKAEVMEAGTGYTNKGVIEINPVSNTSLVLERIAEVAGVSSTFHYTVPKDEELVVTDVDLMSLNQDDLLVDLVQTDVDDITTVGGGSPALKKSLVQTCAVNGQVKLQVQKTFTTGQNISMNVSTKSGLAPLGLNTLFASVRGAKINTKL